MQTSSLRQTLGALSVAPGRLSPERTLGVSPKLVWPVVGSGSVGAALLAIGEVLGNDRLRAAGVGALGSTLVAATVSYVAPAGVVLPPDFDVVDSHEEESPPEGVPPESALASEPSSQGVGA